MSSSAFEIGYVDGYNGQERKTEEALAQWLLEQALPAVSPFDNTYEEYNRGYDDGADDAGKDWTA